MALHLVFVDRQRSREVTNQRLFKEGVVRGLSGHDLGVELQLAVSRQHCDLGPGQAETSLGQFGHLLSGGQTFDLAIELTGLLQPCHEAGVGVEVGDGRPFLKRDGQGLIVVVGQDLGRDLVGHGRQQHVALFAIKLAGRLDGAGEDLDVDLVVRAVDARRIVDGVGVDATAVAGEGDAARLGEAEVRALADDLDAQLAGLDADRVIGLVADLEVGLARRPDVGADAAEIEELGVGLEDRPHQVRRRQFVLFDVEDGLDLRGQLDGLLVTREDAAALRNLGRVVVGPGRARQLEHPVPLDPARGRIGIGIDEDVHVVEGGHELDLLGQQHAVAEDVAGHVADAHHGEGFGLDVLAHLHEVALDRLPGAARRDAHDLVVVAG